MYLFLLICILLLLFGLNKIFYPPSFRIGDKVSLINPEAVFNLLDNICIGSYDNKTFDLRINYLDDWEDQAYYPYLNEGIITEFVGKYEMRVIFELSERFPCKPTYPIIIRVAKSSCKRITNTIEEWL